MPIKNDSSTITYLRKDEYKTVIIENNNVENFLKNNI